MKKIDWFIIKSYVGPFILTFLIAEFVLVLQFFFVYIDDLMGKGIDMSISLELLLYTAANLLPTSMPLAVLLSSIMAMGNLGEKSELTAMKAAGMSIFRIMRPLICFIIIVGSVSFYFSNNIWGKVRRGLVAGSLEVYPIHNYGAVQIGYHKFYNNQEPDAESKPSKFITVWHKENGKWEMAKVISLH